VAFRKFVTIPPPTCLQMGSAHAATLENARSKSKPLRIHLSLDFGDRHEGLSPDSEMGVVVPLGTGLDLPGKPLRVERKMDRAPLRSPLETPTFFQVLQHAASRGRR
jgi:hypothetical protein